MLFWIYISDTLRAIAQRLTGLGKLMEQTKELPEIDLVRELAEGLDTFITELRDFDKWLTKRGQKHWLKLQSGLTKLRTISWGPKEKAPLTTYLQWRETYKPSIETETYAKKRFKIASNIFNFVDKLYLSIEEGSKAFIEHLAKGRRN